MKNSKIIWLYVFIVPFALGCLKRWLFKTYVDGKPLQTHLDHIQYVVEPYLWGVVILLITFAVFHAFVRRVWNWKSVGKVTIVLVGSIVVIALICGAFMLYFATFGGNF